MKVSLIAHTRIDREAINTLAGGGMFKDRYDRGLSSDAATLIEFAGRTCAQTYHRPNAATAATQDYINNVQELGHLSLFEHASATFVIDGVSRTFLAQLTRHRHLSFSVQSQRLDREVPGVAYHPTLTEHGLTGTGDGDKNMPRMSFYNDMLDGWYDQAVKKYNFVYDMLVERGCTPKEAREAAREFLPQAASCRIVVSGNLRAWLEFVQKRNVPQADRQIQEVAEEISKQLQVIAPEIF